MQSPLTSFTPLLTPSGPYSHGPNQHITPTSQASESPSPRTNCKEQTGGGPGRGSKPAALETTTGRERRQSHTQAQLTKAGGPDPCRAQHCGQNGLCSCRGLDVRPHTEDERSQGAGPQVTAPGGAGGLTARRGAVLPCGGSMPPDTEHQLHIFNIHPVA